MDPACRLVSFQEVQNLARRCQLLTCCAGRPSSHPVPVSPRSPARSGGSSGTGRLMIAPWQSRCPRPRPLLDQGRVRETWSRHSGSPALRPWRAGAVLMTPPGELMPIVYLAVEEAFQGLPTPYDTPGLAARYAGVRRGSCRVPPQGRRHRPPVRVGSRLANGSRPDATALPSPRVLTLHNEFDAWLAREASEYGGVVSLVSKVRKRRWRVGLKLADVATTVNSWYARGCAPNPSYTGDGYHLQDLVGGSCRSRTPIFRR